MPPPIFRHYHATPRYRFSDAIFTCFYYTLCPPHARCRAAFIALPLILLDFSLMLITCHYLLLLPLASDDARLRYAAAAAPPPFFRLRFLMLATPMPVFMIYADAAAC